MTRHFSRFSRFDFYGHETLGQPEKSFRPNVSLRKKRLQLGSGEHPRRA